MPRFPVERIAARVIDGRERFAEPGPRIERVVRYQVHHPDRPFVAFEPIGRGTAEAIRLVELLQVEGRFGQQQLLHRRNTDGSPKRQEGESAGLLHHR